MTLLNVFVFFFCLGTMALMRRQQGWNVYTALLSFAAGSQLPFIFIPLLK